MRKANSSAFGRRQVRRVISSRCQENQQPDPKQGGWIPSAARSSCFNTLCTWASWGHTQTTWPGPAAAHVPPPPGSGQAMWRLALDGEDGAGAHGPGCPAHGLGQDGHRADGRPDAPRTGPLRSGSDPRTTCRRAPGVILFLLRRPCYKNDFSLQGREQRGLYCSLSSGGNNVIRKLKPPTDKQVRCVPCGLGRVTRGQGPGQPAGRADRGPQAEAVTSRI